MTTIYFDTSAWCTQLNTAEAQCEAMRKYVKACHDRGDRMITNEIIHLEARNMAVQRQVPLAEVEKSLRRLELVVNNIALLKAAGIRVLPPDQFNNSRTLKSLDKLHLETALRVGADIFVAYDSRLLSAAALLGIPVRSP